MERFVSLVLAKNFPSFLDIDRTYAVTKIQSLEKGQSTDFTDYTDVLLFDPHHAGALQSHFVQENDLWRKS
jgi:hypothetical protein